MVRVQSSLFETCRFIVKTSDFLLKLCCFACFACFADGMVHANHKSGCEPDGDRDGDGGWDGDRGGGESESV